MSLLMPSRPIVINPDLAYSIGLNEAIALQQVNYWLKETTSGLERDGERWIYNTTEQWLEQFPFWSESTLKRTFTRLKALGVLKIEQLNKSQRDMTNYYTINYESELLDDVKVSESKRSKRPSPSGQNDTMEGVKVTRSIRSNQPLSSGQFALMILQRLQQRVLQRIKPLLVRKLRNRTTLVSRMNLSLVIRQLLFTALQSASGAARKI